MGETCVKGRSFVTIGNRSSCRLRIKWGIGRKCLVGSQADMEPKAGG